jgi:hypothetical protein
MTRRAPHPPPRRLRLRVSPQQGQRPLNSAQASNLSSLNNSAPGSEASAPHPHSLLMLGMPPHVMSRPVWASDGRRADDGKIEPPRLAPARSRDSSRDASCRRRHGTVGAGLPLRTTRQRFSGSCGNQSSVGYLAVCGHGHAGCWLLAAGCCMIRGAPSTLCEAVVNYIAEHGVRPQPPGRTCTQQTLPAACHGHS